MPIFDWLPTYNKAWLKGDLIAGLSVWALMVPTSLKNHPDGETFPGLAIVRFDGGLFFVNSGALEDHLRDIRIREEPGLNGVILSMEGVDFIDTEGADTIKAIAEAGKQHNIDLHLARVKPQVAEVLQRDGLLDVMPREHFHSDIAAAVKMHVSKFPSDEATKQ